MQNSKRFLTAYNRIDHTMRELAGVKHFLAFNRLIDQAKMNHPLVRKYEEDLRSYAKLRNAIIHNRTSVEYIIAEPHMEVVEKIEKIDKELLVGQLFRKPVRTFQMKDSLNEMLQVIRKQNFSQFPIYEGAFKGLLTTVGIVNWLVSSMEGMHFLKNIPRLAEILNYEKNKHIYQFIRSSMIVYEVKEIFKQGVSLGKRLEALLITEHGRPHQKLIGIVSPIDIMKED